MDQPGTQFENIVRLMREAQYARADEACDQLARVLPATGSFEAGLLLFLTFGSKGECLRELADYSGSATAFELMETIHSQLSLPEVAEHPAVAMAIASYAKWSWMQAAVLFDLNDDRTAAEVAAERCLAAVPILRAHGEHSFAGQAVRTHAEARARLGDPNEVAFFRALDDAAAARGRGAPDEAVEVLRSAARTAERVSAGIIRAELEFELGCELGQELDFYEEEAAHHMIEAAEMVPGSFLDGLASLTAGGLLCVSGDVSAGRAAYSRAEQVLRTFGDHELHAEAKGRLEDLIRRS